MISFASFETDKASRYLTALCKHFGQKVEAECNAHDGWVQFPFGRCEMVASATQLTFSVSATTQRQVDLTIEIVSNHLERFAFRENPTLNWQVSNQKSDPQKEPST